MAEGSYDTLFLRAILAELSDLNGLTSTQLQEVLFELESAHDVESLVAESSGSISAGAVGFLVELKQRALIGVQILEEEAD